MVTSCSKNYFSPEEYLEGEKYSQIKHEYVDGEVYAMSGASDAHVTISLNAAMLLRNHHRGSGCRVYVADMKVQIKTCDINRYYYPDVMVTCDGRDKESEYFKAYPCLIIEVLSDTTEAIDRGKRFKDYRRLASLQEYVIISQKIMDVEVFRRNEKGGWELSAFEAGELVEFASVNFCCDISEFYEDVDLDTRNFIA
ncbi:hypothetical protein NIES4101_55540 [Calothrix sp. NIES-4101]|nr:hypothetical protein NIES4101_55540 [Calothrix sp. NIES-4101]